VKAFVVPPLSRQQVPCPGELMPRTRSPRRAGDDDQALDMARSGRQLRRPVPRATLSLHSQLKTSNILLEYIVDCWVMANWSFLISHARVLMCIAHDPGAGPAARGGTPFVVCATAAESERGGAGAPPVLRRWRHYLPGKSAGGRDHDQRPVTGTDREGRRVILLENAQDVGDLVAVTRAGPAPADHDPLADIGGCEADLEPVAHAGHLLPGWAARRRVPGPGPGAWIVAGLGATAGSGGGSAASTSLAARAFIVSPPPHWQPPGQGSGPAACIGHRRPQPAARQCARHEHGHG
jgi:hypothetical protein